MAEILNLSWLSYENKNIFLRDYNLNWPEEVFLIKNPKNTTSWTYFIRGLNDEEIVRRFWEKELQ